MRGALSRTSRITTQEMEMNKTVPKTPPENRNPKDPGHSSDVVADTTKGHRDDEKNNIEEQGDRANVRQNTSNRRSG